MITTPSRMATRTALVLVAAVCASAAATTAAVGAESSATNFPLGVNTALSGIFPPAGQTEFYNYDVFYTAGKYQANVGNPAPPSLHTFIFAEAFRVNHTWLDITPDITLGSGFALNGVHQTLTVAGTHASNGFQFADPDIIPYNFDFHVLPNLWVAHILNIFPGVGTYDKRHLVNAGLNFTTIAPELTFTYMPTPAIEISLDAWVGFNTRNNATKYQTGTEFNIDYVVGYRPVPSLPALQVGVNGYFYHQLADDKQYGQRVGDGNRGQVLGIGPSVRYDIGHGGLIAKWQHEVAVENRSKGDRFWLQFALPL